MTEVKKYTYIDREFYEAALNVDLLAEDQLEQFQRAVYYASALINAFTGNRIEGVGMENLTKIQQGGVKDAVVFQVAHFLNTGELDGQRGAISYSGGGQSFAFNMPGEGRKTLRIDEKAIFALQQVGLLNTVIGVDPIKDRKEKQPLKDRKYYKWGINAMDDSLFVSDGTTEDGGRVGLKISDKFQTEIDKVSNLGKVKNHIVYRDNIQNVDSWGDNALIPKSYLEERVPHHSKIRKEWDKFRNEMQLKFDLLKGRAREIIERLRIELKQALDDQDKRIELIGDAFGKLNQAFEDLKKDAENWKPELIEMLEEFEDKWKDFIERFAKSWSDNLDLMDEKLNRVTGDMERQLKTWLVEELKKDKYRGGKGKDAELLNQKHWDSDITLELKDANWRDYENPYRGRSSVILGGVVQFKEITNQSIALTLVNGSTAGYPRERVEAQLAISVWFGAKIANYFRIWSLEWFKEDEDLGDIITQHRALQQTVNNQAAMISELKTQMGELNNKVFELQTSVRLKGSIR